MPILRPQLILSSILVFVLIHLLGCAGRQPAPLPAAEKEAVRNRVEIKEAVIPPVYSDGSLYQAASYLNDLFVDTKARRIGDIVTIQIVESSKAINSADTKTGRASSLEAGIETLFDIEDWYINKVLDDIPRDLPRPNPFGNPSVKGSMTSDFDGSGTTSRSGNLTAFITCRVTEVLPNGNLKIVGSREVLVNHETQMIILSGIIRPRDISDNNVIQSTFISNAKIAYSGTGVINDRQRPGWLSNLLNTVWPF